MEKKKIFITGCIILIVIAIIAIFLATGMVKKEVYLKDFKISDDGKIMTIYVDTLDSSGYIRKMKSSSGSMNGYYTFYQTYGFNSKLGSKDSFEIELTNNMDEIYFYTKNKGYKLVLTKHQVTDEWIKISYADKESIKMNLPKLDMINKVGINTGSQDNNYFEYTDKSVVSKIYNMFINLETTNPSTTYNPEYLVDDDIELYDVFIDTDEFENKFEYDISVYRKEDKYYVEQRYNGIYEITLEDFNIIRSYANKDISYEEDIELKTELSFESSMDEDGNYISFNEGRVSYDVYIKDNKLYAKKLDTNEEKIVFDKEDVKGIAVRPICCTGNGNLLILTTNGNVYMSNNDCNYFYTFNMKYNKLDVKDIVSFKLIPVNDYDIVKNLYGVDSKGNEILLHKIN